MLEQFLVATVSDGPIEFGFGNKPGSQNVECQMMFPSEIFGGLNFVPAEIGFGFLVGRFDEKALTLACCQNGQRRISGSVAEAIVAFAVLVSAHDHPFFSDMAGFSLILPHLPNPSFRQ